MYLFSRMINTCVIIVDSKMTLSSTVEWRILMCSNYSILLLRVKYFIIVQYLVNLLTQSCDFCLSVFMTRIYDDINDVKHLVCFFSLSVDKRNKTSTVLSLFKTVFIFRLSIIKSDKSTKLELTLSYLWCQWIHTPSFLI